MRIIEPLDPDPTGLPRFVVELEDGERLEAVVQDGSAALPGLSSRDPYGVGDEVVVTRFTGPAAVPFVAITEPWRVPLLGLVAAVCRRGPRRRRHARARSLVALALTLTVVVKLVVPLLLRGF